MKSRLGDWEYQIPDLEQICKKHEAHAPSMGKSQDLTSKKMHEHGRHRAVPAAFWMGWTSDLEPDGPHSAIRAAPIYGAVDLAEQGARGRRRWRRAPTHPSRIDGVWILQSNDRCEG